MDVPLAFSVFIASRKTNQSKDNLKSTIAQVLSRRTNKK